MSELLTTEEAATYLRLSERKLYELVANGAVPCTKVTGKWLFPKSALDRWLAAGYAGPSAFAQAPAPPIIGGSHDPLLEWALRESASRLASLPEGSEAGLQRLARGEVIAAAIHLHRLDGDDDVANVEAVANTQGLHDVVLIAFARREQGLVVAPGPKGPRVSMPSGTPSLSASGELVSLAHTERSEVPAEAEASSVYVAVYPCSSGRPSTVKSL